jgi:hypothetical protein
MVFFVKLGFGANLSVPEVIDYVDKVLEWCALTSEAAADGALDAVILS